MADVIKFKISSAVALYVRPGVSVDQKLSGLETASSLTPFDHVTLLFCLMKDADVGVKESACTLFADLPENVIINYASSNEAHPSVLDALAKGHYSRPKVAEVLLSRTILSEPAREFLLERMVSIPAVPVNPPNEDYREINVQNPTDDMENQADGESGESNDESEVATEEIDADEDLYLSKYKVAMVMGISEKIKMALSGDKEWRSILIKDSNKLVSGSVIKNPRITDGEILTILKVGVQNDEIIRLICANKEWTKNYMIRKALIDCPKTPLPNSLRYLASLNEKDIASYAKSKNISSVLSTQAKRMLLAKKR